MQPPGQEHVDFTQWAKRQGVQINGVAPAQFPGRGLGIAAQEDIREGDVLVRVPISALLTAQMIPEDFRSKHQGITIHGLLASFLAFSNEPDTVARYEPWRNVWPSFANFKESMPILWPEKIKAFYPDSDIRDYPWPGLFALPPAISGLWADESIRYPLPRGSAVPGSRCVRESSLLGKQEQKLRNDFTIVKSAIPTAELEKYTYSWLIVNTRTFYFVAPGMETPSNPDDCMALCPFADYFNHASSGCPVTFDKDGFTVTSDKSYERGEEIYVSYGNHNNDILLTEYGFILEHNSSDSLIVDDLIYKAGNGFPKPTKKELEKAGYLDNYTLTTDGPCYRTLVAARIQTMENRHWWQFVRGKEFGPRSDQETEDWIIMHITAKYANEALQALERLDMIKDDCSEHVLLTLERRWKQIFEICKSAMQGRMSDRAGNFLSGNILSTMEFDEWGSQLLKAVGLSDPKSWVYSERFSDW